MARMPPNDQIHSFNSCFLFALSTPFSQYRAVIPRRRRPWPGPMTSLATRPSADALPTEPMRPVSSIKDDGGVCAAQRETLCGKTTTFLVPVKQIPHQTRRSHQGSIVSLTNSTARHCNNNTFSVTGLTSHVNWYNYPIRFANNSL
jgi:hypothetical protein